MGSERNKAITAAVLESHEQQNSSAGGGGGTTAADRIEGIPTATVSVSRLFFENKVKEIAASMPLSPRNSLLLPRKWGYSPYAPSTLNVARRIDFKVNTIPSPSSFSTAASRSQSLSVSESADGMDKRKERERAREGDSDVLGAKDFAERKAFFQDQILDKAAASSSSSSPSKGFSLTSQFCSSPASDSPTKSKSKPFYVESSAASSSDRCLDRDKDRDKDGDRDGLCLKRGEAKSVRDMVCSLQMQRRTLTG